MNYFINIVFILCLQFTLVNCNTRAGDAPNTLFESKDSGTTEHKNKASVNDLPSLISYMGNASELYVNSPDRGGVFKLTEKNNLANDYGMIFPSSRGNNWHWMREPGKDSVINLKWYGAKGLGVKSYKDDSTALFRAVNYMKSKGGGKLYIPAAPSFYAFNGNGIVLSDNMEIYGDGEKSEIKHINPASGTYYRGVVFFTTTYGPSMALSVIREPSFPIQDAPVSQSFVTLNNQQDAAKLKVGSLVVLGGRKFYKNNDPKSPRLGQFEINEITNIEANKIILKYPLSTPLTTGQEPPVIINVNANATYNDKLGVYDRISKNIYIHDLKLSQADYDMIDNTPYDVSRPPSNLIALGGTFESRFQHLFIQGAGTFGGNMWDRCEISNLEIVGYRKVLDLGYGSCNSVIHDINWQYADNKADTTKISMMYLNEASHNVEIYNLKATGNWSGKSLIQIAGGANHIYLHDIVFNLPDYTGPVNAGIFIKDDDDKIFVHHITLKNITINVKSVGQFIKIEGNKSVADERDIVLDNVKFTGKTTNFKKYTVDVNNAGNIVFKDVTIPEGDYVRVANSKNAKIDNLDAPNSYLINSSDNGSSASVSGGNVKGTTNTDKGNQNLKKRKSF